MRVRFSILLFLLNLLITNAVCQEKLQEKFIELKTEVSLNGPEALIEGRSAAIKAVKKYGDNSEYYGAWAWLTYFNSNIILKHQSDEELNLGGLRGLETELLREAEDALNKAYILVQSDNEFRWSYHSSYYKDIINKAAYKLISAKRNGVMIGLNETEDYGSLKNAHGHFNWILDYGRVHEKVKGKIEVYNDELAGFLFGNAIAIGDTARAEALTEKFHNELLKSYNRAYIKLIQNKPAEALKIFKEQDRKHWERSYRAAGCKQFISTFIELGYTDDHYLNPLVDGFINSSGLRKRDYEEIGYYLDQNGLYEQASKVYRAGLKRSVAE